MSYVLAVLFGLAVLLVGPEAQAEKRIALVIGNSAYQNTTELTNPRNDATDMSAALTRLGFDVVEGRDLDKRSLERTIRQFGLKLAGADLALFFYAGHGLQIGGQNYLVPTDARLTAEGDVDFESVPLSLVLKQMEREAKTSVILLDACRDNPLARNLARTMGTRSSQISQGLAEVRTSVGTLIGFSTQPGNVALDGASRNSPYAEAILKNIEAPGKGLTSVLVAVRNEVLQTTAGKQVPWEHTSLTGEIYLKPDPSRPAEASTPPPASAPSYDKEMELAFWAAVKDAKSPALLQTYIDRFPAGTFAGLARAMIEQLKKETVVDSGAPPTKTASLPPNTTPPQSAPAAPVSDPAALTRTLQMELRRVGCDPGSVDGKWGAQGKKALEQFARLAKVSVPTEDASEAALRALAGQTDRVCPLECDRGETEINGKCVAKSKPKAVEKVHRRTVEREERPARRSSGSSEREERQPSKGLCWQQDGRTMTVSPCK